MDGSYRLRQGRTGRVAILEVRGTTVRLNVPPEAPASQLLDSHLAALAAMNAELVRLTTAGWTLDEVEAGVPRVEPPKPADAPPVHALDCIAREGTTIRVDASAAEVSQESALEALRPVLAGGEELVISGCQSYDAPWYQTVAPWCAAVAELGGRELTRFVVDTAFETLTRQASVHCDDLTRLFRVCPALRFAYVIGWAPLESLALDHLEDLTLMSDPLGSETVAAVLRGPLPRLSRLALGLAYEGEAEHGADAALAAGIAAGALPSLTELHIAGPEDGLALLDALAGSPALARLRVLSIEGNVFDDEERGVEVLRRHRAALSGLEALYLPLEDVMDLGDDELASIIPCLRGIDDVETFSPARYRAR